MRDIADFHVQEHASQLHLNSYIYIRGVMSSTKLLEFLKSFGDMRDHRYGRFHFKVSEKLRMVNECHRRRAIKLTIADEITSTTGMRAHVCINFVSRKGGDSLSASKMIWLVHGQSVSVSAVRVMLKLLKCLQILVEYFFTFKSM